MSSLFWRMACFSASSWDCCALSDSTLSPSPSSPLSSPLATVSNKSRYWVYRDTWPLVYNPTPLSLFLPHYPPLFPFFSHYLPLSHITYPLCQTQSSSVPCDHAPCPSSSLGRSSGALSPPGIPWAGHPWDPRWYEACSLCSWRDLHTYKVKIVHYIIGGVKKKGGNSGG